MADHDSISNEDQAQQEIPLQTRISDRLDANIFLYWGLLDRESVHDFLDEVEKRPRRQNVALVLSTYGGDADAAYTLARCLKDEHERLILYVFGLCKSAGTIVALGADYIVMSRRGEFGPLDVQVPKPDEWVPLSSSMDMLAVLRALTESAFNLFEYHFLELKRRSGFQITTKTAADVATALSVGLLSPVTAQLDPLKLGEIYRANNIAFEYGRRLGVDREALEKLIWGYPSHGFVIGREEANELFGTVREPDDDERELETALREFSVSLYGSDVLWDPDVRSPVMACISPTAEETSDASDQGESSDASQSESQEALQSTDESEACDSGQTKGKVPRHAKARKRRATKSRVSDPGNGV